MKKIAIFAEGLTEQIFVRYFLSLTLGWDKISFECFKLHADSMIHAPFTYRNKNAEIYFLIVNVANDERVLSAVKEREEKLIQRGYEKIIALRDMYSQAYRNKAGHEIKDTITEEFISGSLGTIQKMSDPDKIKICFAIMELEAWFLSMHNMFERIDPALTITYIEEKLGFNLSIIDPQTEFFKPADILINVLELIGLQYDKSAHVIESICSKININDFSDAFENGRCISFKSFHDEILN